jgi:hypothetical protein
MPRGKRSEDTTLLSMALVGYEAEKQKIDERIRELRARLGGSSQSNSATVPAPSTNSASNAAPAKKRTLSAAARKRIAAAQKKRWAEHRKRLSAGS